MGWQSNRRQSLHRHQPTPTIILPTSFFYRHKIRRHLIYRQVPFHRQVDFTDTHFTDSYIYQQNQLTNKLILPKIEYTDKLILPTIQFVDNTICQQYNC